MIPRMLNYTYYYTTCFFGLQFILYVKIFLKLERFSFVFYHWIMQEQKRD